MKGNNLVSIFGLTIQSILIVLNATLNRSGSLLVDYSSKVKGGVAGQTMTGEEILIESDIAYLSAPVRKYVIYSAVPWEKANIKICEFTLRLKCSVNQELNL
ncbi:MAG: hypothetical protein RBT02_05770 [Bacteroidales bacterium]|jgi:hypothetical protein|nr:hypothetical protein [Bacteroidales bacterium]